MAGGTQIFLRHSAAVTMATPSKTPPGADPKQLERTGTVREIGSQAVWSLSSCKPGFGVDQLRDDNLETYWQSDGSQPHLVNIQFRRRTTVRMLCIYADYKSDESYTPSKISVRVGNNFHNLQEIRQLEMVEPSGWIHISLLNQRTNEPISTFMIQIAVLANHQNGRDTHMRQIKVYTPVEESSIGKFPRCTTVDFMMYRTISRSSSSISVSMSDPHLWSCDLDHDQKNNLTQAAEICFSVGVGSVKGSGPLQSGVDHCSSASKGVS
ncbi:Anaphase-promoting complex subunit 10 [Crenichthys baileyi]|uniref:Anaphase-promoting complex subunit 10 n=2 Tax=Goodeidae TaxID=28758 RepID=A0AAV9RPC6_9TELE